MNFRRSSLVLLSLAFPPLLTIVDAQVEGVILSSEMPGMRMPIPGAIVKWDQGNGITADGDGHFVLPVPAAWPATLRVSAIGFGDDSLFMNAMPVAPLTFLLAPVTQLKEAQVTERQHGTVLSTRSLQAIEAIGPKELKRAACCDLSESFESNATVDVSFSDAISGTKTIRMLGLDGKYAQIGVENIPFVRGLSSNYGLTLIPGPWINSINVSKGIGTAVNGPNAMTGQIDLCLLDPEKADRFFTNLYVNNQGRTELNINAAQHLSSTSNNEVLFQGSLMQRDMDDNADGFRDQPQTSRINIMDRWLQRKNRRTSQVIARYVFDGRSGGQTSAHHLLESPGVRHYIADITNEMADVIAKNGWILRDSTKSIGMLASFRNHTVSSTFGDRGYEGSQQSVYANVVYQQLLKHDGDQLKMGANFQVDDYTESFRDSAFARTERMPGVFAEYTRARKRFTLVAGARGDFNSEYGNAFSPRLHLKYDIGPLTTVRLSVGSAFRSANPIVENASALASSRNVVVEGPIGLERSWNSGVSFLHKFKWLDRKWVFAVDVYRSDFTAQVVSDLDRSPRTLAIYMLHGPSFANSLLTDVQVALTRTLDLKLSYRFYDVRTTYDGVLRERPFTPTHRGLIDLAFISRNDKWRIDGTLNIFGTARLPDTSTNPDIYRLPARSPVYATLHTQITRVLSAWEFYIGGENLTSVVQHTQIMAPQDPFGPYFDASIIWGPTNGAMFYAGLRFALKRKTTNP